MAHSTQVAPTRACALYVSLIVRSACSSQGPHSADGVQGGARGGARVLPLLEGGASRRRRLRVPAGCARSGQVRDAHARGFAGKAGLSGPRLALSSMSKARRPAPISPAIISARLGSRARRAAFMLSLRRMYFPRTSARWHVRAGFVAGIVWELGAPMVMPHQWCKHATVVRCHPQLLADA